MRAGNHFKFASVSWTPTANTRVVDGVTEREVEFSVRATYSRTYQWGTAWQILLTTRNESSFNS